MNRTNSSFNRIYFVLLIGSIGIFLNLIIPPFQNPDEPQHFGAILNHTYENENKVLIEKEIIKLMDDYKWWRYMGLGHPTELPEKFSQINLENFRYFDVGLMSMNSYHFFMGKILRIFSINDLRYSYYFCRFTSLLFSLGTLLLTCQVFKNISLKSKMLFTWAAFLPLFLPQFQIIAISVNPDPFIIFLGTLFFYSLFSLMMNDRRLVYLITAFLTAIIGLFSDKSSFFMLPLLIIFLIFYTEKKGIRHYLFFSFILLLLFVISISWAVWFFPDQYYNSLFLFKQDFLDELNGIMRTISFSSFNKAFFILLVDSFLFRFGWMAFEADKIFYFLWRTFILFSMVGFFIYVFKSSYYKIKEKQNSISNNLSLLKIAAFSFTAFFLQLAVLWITQASRGILPQGRYLFPLILSIAFLFAFGLNNFFALFHRQIRKVAIASFVVFLFFFLNYCIWNYMIPIFHLTVKSPHPGI